MNRRLQACLVSLTIGAISGAVFAQSGVNVPLQRGVSVQLVVTSNAVAVPNADQPDALVVALTADGTTYLRADPLPTPALANRVRSILSTRNEKTLYIKADGCRRCDVADGTTGRGGPREQARAPEGPADARGQHRTVAVERLRVT